MNKASKHLLFITPGFPKDELDTRCIPAMHLFLTELNKSAQFQISIIALDYPYTRKTYSWNGLKVYALGGQNKKWVKKLLLYRRAIEVAKSIHHDQPVSQIHSFWLGDAAMIGSRLSKKWSIKHSCSLMGQDVLSSNKYFRRISTLPELVCLSRFHAKSLLDNWNLTPKHLINWGIEDLSHFRSSSKVIDILGVGNLSDIKSYDRFISILDQIRTTNPNIKATIIGEGEEELKLKRLIQESNLEANVELVGVKNREQTLKIMGESRCLLHTSSFESFGLVFLEALALGLKIYTTPVGIAKEISAIEKFENDEYIVEKLRSDLQSEIEQPVQYPFKIQETTQQYINHVF